MGIVLCKPKPDAILYDKTVLKLIVKMFDIKDKKSEKYKAAKKQYDVIVLQLLEKFKSDDKDEEYKKSRKQLKKVMRLENKEKRKIKQKKKDERAKVLKKLRKQCTSKTMYF